jgi:hypothetical protein
MNLGTVISLCDMTGNMVEPWLDAGYKAITVDLQDNHSAHPRRNHFVADVTALPHKLISDPVAVFAFPPCTNVAVSGARWFKEKGLDRFRRSPPIGASQITLSTRQTSPALSLATTIPRRPAYGLATAS